MQALSYREARGSNSQVKRMRSALDLYSLANRIPSTSKGAIYEQILCKYRPGNSFPFSFRP